MSILACLIGILTLMISVTLQVKQMDKQDRTEEEMARAVANRDLKKKAQIISSEIRNLEEKLKVEKSTAAEMAKLEDQKIVLKQKLDEIRKATNLDQTDISIQKTVEIMKAEIVALKSGRPPLQQQLAALQQELKNRKIPPKVVESVVIRPGGIGTRGAEKLFFVECSSTGIILINGNSSSQPISNATIQTSQDYSNFLEKVKRARDPMVLFLVRKGGNEAYLWAAGIAESKYKLKNGKLPIPNDGKIDLSLFN